MEKFDIDNQLIKELDSFEVKTINGGTPKFWRFLGKISGILGLIMLIEDIVDNWDKIEEGWEEGCEAAESMFKED
jgi:hypothetical protein